MQADLLPLFPLRVVLFPRIPLPLHIFEERYKLMVGEAIRANSEIGIVLATPKGVVNVGCTAVIDRVLERYEDGRLDVLAVGQRRFQIHALDYEREYLRGTVEYFDDEDTGPVPEGLPEEVMEPYIALRELKGSQRFPAPKTSDPQLSFQLAFQVGDLEFRQLLLRMKSETDRLKQLADFLPRYLEKLRGAAEAKRIIPLNGHSRGPQTS
jgi:Lon protease-like protein